MNFALRVFCALVINSINTCREVINEQTCIEGVPQIFTDIS